MSTRERLVRRPRRSAGLTVALVARAPGVNRILQKTRFGTARARLLQRAYPPHSHSRSKKPAHMHCANPTPATVLSQIIRVTTVKKNTNKTFHIVYLPRSATRLPTALLRKSVCRRCSGTSCGVFRSPNRTWALRVRTAKDKYNNWMLPGFLFCLQLKRDHTYIVRLGQVDVAVIVVVQLLMQWPYRLHAETIM